MQVFAYISLGSNLGDGPGNLAEARRLLADIPGCRPVACSRVYRTEPQEKKEQAWFHNQVLCLEPDSGWTPERLLQTLLDLETQMGRARNVAERFGPRIIDLDLLLFGNEVRRGADPGALNLPHPRLEKRAFVLVPLQEIAPELIIPSHCPETPPVTVAKALAALPYRVTGNTIYQ